MTIALDKTSAAGSFAAYVVTLARQLADRPEGRGVCLLLAPATLPEVGDIVYVQSPIKADGTATLYPVPLKALQENDLIAATQRVNLADKEYVQAYLASGYYGHNDHCGKDALTNTHQYD